MSVYLHDIPLPEARQRLETALRQAGLWGRLRSETIPLDESAVGRVLAEPVWAKISSPHYHASAMDGFAVRSVATQGAHAQRAGDAVTVTSSAAQQRAAYLDTGDPLPDWADAVIPMENVEPLDENGRPTAETRRPRGIRIRAAVSPWTYVRPLGEDIVATQLVLPAGHTLRPVDLGAVAACGHRQLKVAAGRAWRSCRPAPSWCRSASR